MSNKYNPYWNPWGVGGCLWRTILFLLGMILMSILFSLIMRGCQGTDDEGSQRPYDPAERNEYPEDTPEELRDNSPVGDWNDSIPGVEELPSPEDNYIPPVDSTEVIVNPDDPYSKIVDGQLIVFFNSKDLKTDMARFAQKFKQMYPSDSYEVIYYNPTAGTMLLGVPSGEMSQVAERLEQNITDIDFRIATNDILQEGVAQTPSDPGFTVARYSEYFKLIQAYQAWGITKGSRDVKVAIVDSYFDLTNPEIGERYVDRIFIPTKTTNVLPPKAKPTKNDLTPYTHGSHVAGIAIGAQDNALGCSGLAPECSWIPIALGSQLSTFNIMEGILYAVYHGADVVNFSIGRSFPQGANEIPLEEQIAAAKTMDRRGEALWEYIIKTANDHNCVLCTSAGNETVLMGLDPKNRGQHIIKVEAVDGKGMMAPFSNFGKAPEGGLMYSTVSAPGVNLWSVSPKHCLPLAKSCGYVVSEKQGFQEMSGTSMASPVVAGAVALLKSKKKDISTEDVIKILTSTAKQFDQKHRIGPTIQIFDALNATGGEMLNFDDLMKNHNLLIGKWKSTYELSIVDKNNKKIDDMWTYFIFTSATKGTLEMHTINTHKVYSAPVDVVWSSNSVKFVQLRDAVAPDGDTVNKDDFVCHPDAARLLEASCQRNGKERYKFKLEKVN